MLIVWLLDSTCNLLYQGSLQLPRDSLSIIPKHRVRRFSPLISVQQETIEENSQNIFFFLQLRYSEMLVIMKHGNLYDVYMWLWDIDSLIRLCLMMGNFCLCASAFKSVFTSDFSRLYAAEHSVHSGLNSNQKCTDWLITSRNVLFSEHETMWLATALTSTATRGLVFKVLSDTL